MTDTIDRVFADNVAAADRFWFYKDTDGTSLPAGGGVYPGLEYEEGRLFQTPGVVYVKGDVATLKLKLRNDTPATPVDVSFALNYLKLSEPGHSDITLSASAANTSFSLNYWASDEVEITFTVPSSVALGTLKLKYTLTVDCGNPLHAPETHVADTSIERLYATEAEPLGHQIHPWTDLLDKGCEWAYGESGVTDVVPAATFGLYWGSIFAYNLGTPNVPDIWILTPSGHVYYNLSGLLTYCNTYGIADGNCADVSFFLQLVLQSLGIEAEAKQLFYNSNPDGFLTNLVCPIGSDGSQLGYYFQTAFLMHQQCYVDDEVNDAALAYRHDLSGATYMNPASMWGMPSYWQVFVSGSPPLAYGLTFRPILLGDTYSGYIWTPGGGNAQATSHYGPNLVSHEGVK